jgi:hypothetical protein
MAGDEGVETDEKVLIIASAVLGTILVSLLCFAALYKSFLAQYASAYDSHVKMLNPFSADMVGRPDSALAGASPAGSPGLNQVQIKLASSPSTNDFDVVQPAQPAPKIAETSFGSGYSGKATSPVAGGHGGTTPAWGSPSNEADEGEFFSADEQARIWAELREAENNAAGASVSVNAARTAAAAAATGEYVETFASQANVGMAQSVTVNVNAGLDDDDDDANTKFGFDEADLNMSGMSSNAGSPARSPAQPPDYIDGNHLEATGQTFSGPGSPASPMGVNADNEWWK